MTLRVTSAITGAIVVAMLVAALWTINAYGWSQIVPVHFNLAGRPNGWAPAGPALLMLPGLGAGLWVLRAILPRITPRGENLERSATAYGVIWIAATLVIALAEAAMIASTARYPVNIGAAMPALVGLTFLVIGNVLPKLRWNYVVGIRTPWTLADERVWDQTHRFGGWAMVIGGLILLIGAAIPPYAPKPGLVAGIGGLVALASVIKSYLLWKDRQRAGG